MVNLLRKFWRYFNAPAKYFYPPYPMAEWSELPDELLPEGYERIPGDATRLRRIDPPPPSLK